MIIKLRLIKKEDISQIAAIYARVFNEVNIHTNWTQETAEKFINYWYKKTPNLFWVATTNNKIIGGIWGEVMPYWNGPNLADIYLFVDIKYQNKGVGKQLLTKLISEAKSKYKIADLSMLVNNRKKFPLNWYQKIGFTKSGWIEIEAKPAKIIKNINKKGKYD